MRGTLFGPALLTATLLLNTTPEKARAAPQTKSVECSSPDSTKKTKVRINRLQKDLMRLKRRFQKGAVHALDLPEESLERWARLPQDLAAESWCQGHSHLRSVNEALDFVIVNTHFVTEKFERVERWARARYGDIGSSPVAKNLTGAAKAISSADTRKANRELNKAIAILFDLSSQWALPNPLPGKSEALSEEFDLPELRSIDIESGCPKLSERQRANTSELLEVTTRLKKLMNRRSVRPADLKGGEALLKAFKNYRSISATWPAARILCSLTAQIRELEVDLGFVMGRFHRIGKAREVANFGEEDDGRFRELIRQVSGAVAEKEFIRAHDTTEKLFVLLGLPRRPGSHLD